MGSVDRTHAWALEVSARYRRGEAELMDALISVEERRVFLSRGHSSLFKYVVTELGISENTAYSLITVARKVREVPELGVKFRAGEITLSKARRVAAVLTAENQEEWLKKACTLSCRKLEREIARVRPEVQTPEIVSYVGDGRVRVQFGLSEAEILKLRHVQDLLCQSKRQAVTLEETVGAMTTDFIKRLDPVARARRQIARNGAKPRVVSTPDFGTAGARAEDERTALVQVSPSVQVESLVTRRGRVPISAASLHTVNLRDQGRCTHLLSGGERCNLRRWVEIHHIEPVSEGGSNDPANLTTLCSAHHKFLHHELSSRATSRFMYAAHASREGSADGEVDTSARTW